MEKNNNQPHRQLHRHQENTTDEVLCLPENQPRTQITNRKALTQISQTLQSENTKQGFANAKHDADKALAENKIILNNRFVLESTLGAGGMGTVYKAQDLRKVEARDPNPYVAAKILNSDFKNHPDAFISLQREASRSHKLSHPNIVTVHDFDRDQDTIYMTMELLEGEDLHTLLERHTVAGVPRARALSIIKDFCTALTYAHEKGIIHSDLKPGNIFISKDGAKVLDFGIARLALQSQHQDHFDAGDLGAITPDYASLEMINRQSPDTSDDVYAAAIIAYELLSGVHPFQRKSAATALALGLKPSRIASLSKRQWSALSAALELKREDRTATISEFMTGLTVIPKTQYFKVVSVVLLSVLAWFAYLKFFVPDELTLFIKDTRVKAEECYQLKDYECAINGANAILKIEPRHISANSILKNARNSLFEQNRQQVIEVSLIKAKSCLAASDFDCALKHANLVLQNDTQHAEATELTNKINYEIERKALYLKELDEKFNALIQKAEQCFEATKYECAINNTNRAAEIKPESSAALNLRQNALYALKQQQENVKKANNILKDGRVCYKKLNYSCAIAKSESALEFVPNYAAALKLKKDAEKALANVKKSIEIN